MLELRRGEVHQVQVGAPADALVRVGRIGAQQDAGRVDATAGQHVVPRLDPDALAVGRHAALVHAQAVDADHLVALDQQLVGARQVEQLAAGVEGGGDGSDQHRLLGVGRAAHAAIA